ncbi:MAG TPA: hypothetical protein PL110_08305 [Candidatus Eremiobacteraeota bacterium]|nr:MAG: hypothetical protein BWY64_01803 [bacterium ADurb.Bin363]HPZ08102.1 hypothetical protein [Candidatus Eremiobacteraeota bacterium]
MFVEAIKEAEVIKSKTMRELEKYKGDSLIDLMLKHNLSDYEYKEEKDDNEILYEALKEKYGL